LLYRERIWRGFGGRRCQVEVYPPPFSPLFPIALLLFNEKRENWGVNNPFGFFIPFILFYSILFYFYYKNLR